MFFGFNAFDPRHSPAVSEKQESYASSFTASALGCVPLACEFPQHPSTCARCRWGVLRSTVQWTARSCALSSLRHRTVWEGGNEDNLEQGTGWFRRQLGWLTAAALWAQGQEKQVRR
jgi:hypothetical protein